MSNPENSNAEIREARPAKSRLYPWYDSVWLTRYATAKAIIQKVKPAALPGFVEAFRRFRTRPDFQVREFERVFDEAAMGEIRQVVKSLQPADMELHEARKFGRFVVHNHPFFSELQQRTVALVSEAAGESVEVSYNFLSLYTKLGVCAPHMDSPEAKWTLDLCINQSGPWPIFFSQVNDWPESGEETWRIADWENRLKQSPSQRFRPYTLQPGQAVLFSGSSQWHYRDPMPATSGQQFCDLLFFHFLPSGGAELVSPRNWPRLFDIPELSDIL